MVSHGGGYIYIVKEIIGKPKNISRSCPKIGFPFNKEMQMKRSPGLTSPEDLTAPSEAVGSPPARHAKTYLFQYLHFYGIFYILLPAI